MSSPTYVSTATELLTVPQLVDLEEIRPRNHALGLTDPRPSRAGG